MSLWRHSQPNAHGQHVYENIVCTEAPATQARYPGDNVARTKTTALQLKVPHQDRASPRYATRDLLPGFTPDHVCVPCPQNSTRAPRPIRYAGDTPYTDTKSILMKKQLSKREGSFNELVIDVHTIQAAAEDIRNFGSMRPTTIASAKHTFKIVNIFHHLRLRFQMSMLKTAFVTGWQTGITRELGRSNRPF